MYHKHVGRAGHTPGDSEGDYNRVPLFCETGLKEFLFYAVNHFIGVFFQLYKDAPDTPVERESFKDWRGVSDSDYRYSRSVFRYDTAVPPDFVKATIAVAFMSMAV